MAAHTLHSAIKELYYWQYGGNPSNFSSILYYLFQKSDPENKMRLTIAFPFEAQALSLWEQAPNEEEFFKKYDVWKESENEVT